MMGFVFEDGTSIEGFHTDCEIYLKPADRICMVIVFRDKDVDDYKVFDNRQQAIDFIVSEHAEYSKPYNSKEELRQMLEEQNNISMNPQWDYSIIEDNR